MDGRYFSTCLLHPLWGSSKLSRLNSTMDTLDLFVLIFYLLIILGVGGFFYQRNQSANAFILGNHSLPSWVVSLSFFATFVSSISYLALPRSFGHQYQ